MSSNLHLVFNPKSGIGKGAELPQIGTQVCREFGSRLIPYEISDVESFESQARAAVNKAKETDGIVVAAGGDGTIRGVAQFAADTNVRFAIIPIGTFNYFARNHKIPEEPIEAFRVALTQSGKPVQLGEINGHVFVINASMGLYAKAIQERAARTKKWGRHRIVALLSTVRTLLGWHRHLHVELESDTQTMNLKTPMIFIGNNALQLRDLAMKVALCMKQDLLAVVLMKPLRKFEILRVLARGLFKTIENEKRLESFCVKTMKINTHSSRVMVALDGEIFHLNSPLTVVTKSHCLNLVKPDP